MRGCLEFDFSCEPPYPVNMKKLISITAITLATVCWTQPSYAQGTLPDDELHVPQPGWVGAWPPMPSPDDSYAPPTQSPQYPYPSPPEFVLPDQGIFATTAGLTPIAIPEPSTLALLGVGSLAAFFWCRRD